MEIFQKKFFLAPNKMDKLKNELNKLNKLEGKIFQAIEAITAPRRKGKGWFPKALSNAYKLVKSLGYNIPYGRSKQYADDLVNIYLNQAYYDNSLKIDALKDKIFKTVKKEVKIRKTRKKYFKKEVMGELERTLRPKLSLSKVGQKSSKKMGAEDYEYKFIGIPRNFEGAVKDWKPIKQYIDDILYIEEVIETVIDKINNFEANLFRVIIESIKRDTNENIIMSTELTSRDKIKDELISLLDPMKYTSFTFYDTDIIISTRKLHTGGSSASLDEYLKGRKGFFQIINNDDLCGHRCLALAMYTKQQFNDYKKGKLSIKKNLEKVLKFLPNKKLAFTDFDEYKYKQVVIMGRNTDVLYKTKVQCANKVYLYYDFENEHYHLITNMNTFTRTQGCQRTTMWCDKCERRIKWTDLRGHKCNPAVCKSCKGEFTSEEELLKEHIIPARNCNFLRCPDCNMGCHGPECLNNHIKNVCPNQTENKNKHRWKCISCQKWHGKYEHHKCGEVECKNCGKTFPNKKALEEHRCYIQFPTHEQLESYTKRCKWLVYDFESIIDPITHQHEVNLAMVANSEGKLVFSCKTISEFVDYCLTLKNITMIAHNGKAYDAWLVHQHLIKKTGQRPSKLILAGQKIMCMKIKSTTFIDSINHIASALEGLPKICGFDTEGLKKGFFPYTFNTKDNASYVGPMPDKKHFDPDRMMPDKRNEFIKWYDYMVKNNYVWDHQKELYEYCESDVVILARAMKIYQEKGIESNNGIDPLKSVTIASNCMRTFRTTHMEYETIAVLKKNEYDFGKRAFFGGRTNAISLYKDWTNSVDEGVYGRYIDVQSLYPSVQFYDELPTGAPHWIENPTCIDKIGYYEVDITPPNDLYHPVLPEKKDGKLVFDLLPKTKAVYTSIELNKAVEKGYTITKFYKALVWNESSRDLFKSYVAKNLLQKVQSTGFNGTEEELDIFIKEHKKRFNIDIDPKKLVKNAGMRALAKIQLNSLWGKFGQKIDMKTTKYVKEVDKWQRMLKDHLNGNIELKNDVIIDDDCIYAEYVELKEEKTCLDTTNICLAGFVTAQARLRLYKELDRLGQRVCYFDTDSIIYETDPKGYNTVEGDYLGEWESETLVKDNENNMHDLKITEFVSIGPKSYSYKTNDSIITESVLDENKIPVYIYNEDGTKTLLKKKRTDQYHTKFKGFTLNSENTEKIKFDTMKKMIDENHQIKTRVLEFNKDKNSGTITTKMNEKIASFVYNKRCVVNKYDTLPFGHKDIIVK